jgi:hypothetical protein
METTVRKVADFEVTGSGVAPAWNRTEWLPLTRVGPGKGVYPSRVKTLYSDTGLYFLFDCVDRKLTCAMTEDFDQIFCEDVVELFLWTDETAPLYFEYEVSPLNVELPILIPNDGKTFHGWRPWEYDGPRRTRHATNARGGPLAPHANVEGWMAEGFIPFHLLQGFANCPPKSGQRWRANFYRIDYDQAPESHWAWCPDTGNNFHNFRHFGTILFE